MFGIGNRVLLAGLTILLGAFAPTCVAAQHDHGTSQAQPGLYPGFSPQVYPYSPSQPRGDTAAPSTSDSRSARVHPSTRLPMPIPYGRYGGYGGQQSGGAYGGGSKSSGAQVNPYSTTLSEASATVIAYDNYFEPRTLVVRPGTTVRWVNAGRHNHTATAADGTWDSGEIAPGSSYTAALNLPGTHAYYCRHHTGDKMQGTLVVQEERAADSRFAAVGNLAGLDVYNVRVQPGNLVDVRRVADERTKWDLVMELNSNRQAYRNAEKLTERLQTRSMLRPGERVVGYQGGSVYVMKTR